MANIIDDPDERHFQQFADTTGRNVTEAAVAIRALDDRISALKEDCNETERLLGTTEGEERNWLIYRLQRQRLLYARYHVRKIGILKKLADHRTVDLPLEEPGIPQMTTDNVRLIEEHLFRRTEPQSEETPKPEKSAETGHWSSYFRGLFDRIYGSREEEFGEDPTCDTIDAAREFYREQFSNGLKPMNYDNENDSKVVSHETVLFGSGLDGSSADATVERRDHFRDKREVNEEKVHYVHEHVRSYRLETILYRDQVALLDEELRNLYEKDPDLYRKYFDDFPRRPPTKRGKPPDDEDKDEKPDRGGEMIRRRSEIPTETPTIDETDGASVSVTLTSRDAYDDGETDKMSSGATTPMPTVEYPPTHRSKDIETLPIRREDLPQSLPIQSQVLEKRKEDLSVEIEESTHRQRTRRPEEEEEIYEEIGESAEKILHRTDDLPQSSVERIEASERTGFGTALEKIQLEGKLDRTKDMEAHPLEETIQPDQTSTISERGSLIISQEVEETIDRGPKRPVKSRSGEILLYREEEFSGNPMIITLEKYPKEWYYELPEDVYEEIDYPQISQPLERRTDERRSIEEGTTRYDLVVEETTDRESRRRTPEVPHIHECHHTELSQSPLITNVERYPHEWHYEEIPAEIVEKRMVYHLLNYIQDLPHIPFRISRRVTTEIIPPFGVGGRSRVEESGRLLLRCDEMPLIPLDTVLSQRPDTFDLEVDSRVRRLPPIEPPKAHIEYRGTPIYTPEPVVDLLEPRPDLPHIPFVSQTEIHLEKPPERIKEERKVEKIEERGTLLLRDAEWETKPLEIDSGEYAEIPHRPEPPRRTIDEHIYEKVPIEAERTQRRTELETFPISTERETHYRPDISNIPLEIRQQPHSYEFHRLHYLSHHELEQRPLVLFPRSPYYETVPSETPIYDFPPVEEKERILKRSEEMSEEIREKKEEKPTEQKREIEELSHREAQTYPLQRILPLIPMWPDEDLPHIPFVAEIRARAESRKAEDYLLLRKDDIESVPYEYRRPPSLSYRSIEEVRPARAATIADPADVHLLWRDKEFRASVFHSERSTVAPAITRRETEPTIRRRSTIRGDFDPPGHITHHYRYAEVFELSRSPYELGLSVSSIEGDAPEAVYERHLFRSAEMPQTSLPIGDIEYSEELPREPIRRPPSPPALEKIPESSGVFYEPSISTPVERRLYRDTEFSGEPIPKKEIPIYEEVPKEEIPEIPKVAVEFPIGRDYSIPSTPLEPIAPPLEIRPMERRITETEELLFRKPEMEELLFEEVWEILDDGRRRQRRLSEIQEETISLGPESNSHSKTSSDEVRTEIYRELPQIRYERYGQTTEPPKTPSTDGYEYIGGESNLYRRPEMPSLPLIISQPIPPIYDYPPQRVIHPIRDIYRQPEAPFEPLDRRPLVYEFERSGPIVRYEEVYSSDFSDGEIVVSEEERPLIVGERVAQSAVYDRPPFYDEEPIYEEIPASTRSPYEEVPWSPDERLLHKEPEFSGIPFIPETPVHFPDVRRMAEEYRRQHEVPIVPIPRIHRLRPLSDLPHSQIERISLEEEEGEYIEPPIDYEISPRRGTIEFDTASARDVFPIPVSVLVPPVYSLPEISQTIEREAIAVTESQLASPISSEAPPTPLIIGQRLRRPTEVSTLPSIPSTIPPAISRPRRQVYETVRIVGDDFNVVESQPIDGFYQIDRHGEWNRRIQNEYEIEDPLLERYMRTQKWDIPFYLVPKVSPHPFIRPSPKRRISLGILLKKKRFSVSAPSGLDRDHLISGESNRPEGTVVFSPLTKKSPQQSSGELFESAAFRRAREHSDAYSFGSIHRRHGRLIAESLAKEEEEEEPIYATVPGYELHEESQHHRHEYEAVYETPEGEWLKEKNKEGYGRTHSVERHYDQPVPLSASSTPSITPISPIPHYRPIEHFESIIPEEEEEEEEREEEKRPYQQLRHVEFRERREEETSDQRNEELRQIAESLRAVVAESRDKPETEDPFVFARPHLRHVDVDSRPRRESDPYIRHPTDPDFVPGLHFGSTQFLTYLLRGPAIRGRIRVHNRMPDLRDGFGMANGMVAADELLVSVDSEQSAHWDPTELLNEMYKIDYNPLVEKRNRVRSMEGHMEVPNDENVTVPQIEKPWKPLYFRIKDGRFQWFASHGADENPDQDILLVGAKITANKEDWTFKIEGGKENANYYVRCPSNVFEKWRIALLSNAASTLLDAYVQPVKPPVPHYTQKIMFVELGSCSIRAGILTNKPSLPQIFFPSVAAIDEQTEEIIVGIDALKPEVRRRSRLHRPVESAEPNSIERFKLNEKVVEAVIRKAVADLRIDPQQYKILLSVAQDIPTMFVGPLLRLLLDRIGFISATIARQPSLILYSYDVTTGVVVDIGERLHIVPVIDEYIVDSAIVSLPFGAQQIRDSLKRKLESRNSGLGAAANSPVEHIALRELVRHSCYVATESQSPSNDVFSVDLSKYHLGDGSPSNISVDEVRSLATEGLFEPKKWGLEMKGIHHLIHEVIQQSPIDSRRTLYRNIYLSGGTSLLPGLAERLESELTKIAPPSIFVQVHGSPWRYHAAYLGAQVIANSHQFDSFLTTKANVDEYIRQVETEAN